MGAFLAILKKLAKETVKKGLQDKTKGNNTCASGCVTGCVTGCGLGCLGVVLIVVLVVMGIVGALQSILIQLPCFGNQLQIVYIWFL